MLDIRRIFVYNLFKSLIVSLHISRKANLRVMS